VGDDQLFYLQAGTLRAAGDGDDRQRVHRADHQDAPMEYASSCHVSSS
jgi:hypothetical protein